jgi:hypothetical protein
MRELLAFTDLLLGHTGDLGQKGVVVHLGVVAHLDCFIKGSS